LGDVVIVGWTEQKDQAAYVDQHRRKAGRGFGCQEIQWIESNYQMPRKICDWQQRSKSSSD
jgi:hypothetical protein